MSFSRNNKIEIIKKDETTQKYFDVLARGPTHKFIDDVLKEIKKLRIKNILDVGCGTGYVTKRIAKINPNIIAVDTDEKRIKRLKLNLIKNKADKDEQSI